MYENIRGAGIVQVLQWLIKNQILVKVSVPGKAYQGLAVLAESPDFKRPAFQIDPPQDLKAAMQLTPCNRLIFEFQGSDHLPHRFESFLREIRPEGWRLDFPDCIRRYQLRNNFRIHTPETSCAGFQYAEQKIEMAIENISLGGMFCLCPIKLKSQLDKKPSVDQIELTIALKGASVRLTIPKAKVHRLEAVGRPGLVGVAFEFVHLAGETKKRLIQTTYELQREFLKNRLPL